MNKIEFPFETIGQQTGAFESGKQKQIDKWVGPLKCCENMIAYFKGRLELT